MNNSASTPRRRFVLTGLLAIALTMALHIIGGSAFASHATLPSGNTEDATVQIACGLATDFPINFTINYQVPGFDKRLTYFNNTTACPPPGQPLDFNGDMVLGTEGSGNVTGITILGKQALADGPTVTIPLQTPTGTTTISIRVYRYSGSLYIEIRISRSAS